MCIPLNMEHPAEVFHTALFGLCKYLYKGFVPKLTERVKEEILARVNIHFLNPRGLDVEIYANACIINPP